MSMSRINERTEQAWIHLENWARSWHQPDASGYFAGSLGGASLCQVYFGNVRPESIVKLLTYPDVKFILTGLGGEPNEASVPVLQNVFDLLANRSGGIREDGCIAVRARAPLPGGVFECQIIIEKVSRDSAEILITWVPLLAFRHSQELRDRFFEIFGWFFLIQEILEIEKIFLCLENCPHPAKDSLDWVEI
jgi:hypothetical protein